MRILSQREQYAYRILGFTDDEYRQHVENIEKALDEQRRMGRDSRSIHGIQRRGGGFSWSPKRKKDQNQLVREMYAQRSQGVPQEGLGMLMGGLGGSGKGTILRNPDAGLEGNRYMTVNSDDIKEEMARRGMIPQIPGLSPMESVAMVHEESSELARRLAQMAYKDRRNVLWDMTMGSDSSTKEHIDNMRKHGYGQVDAAFVDADAPSARQRVYDRHRRGETAYRETGQGFGGRYVVQAASKANEPTPGSGKRSKNAEVFERNLPLFDNTVNFDVTGPGGHPAVTQTTGSRWHGHPLSAGGSTAVDNIVARRRRMMMAAEDEQSGPTVEDLLDSYEQGQISYEDLVSGIAEIGHFETVSRTHEESYQRAEDGPDPNSFAHVETAEFNGVLTPEQVEQIAAAIEETSDGG
jgi:predicted ABC-type ATPase